MQNYLRICKKNRTFAALFRSNASYNVNFGLS